MSLASAGRKADYNLVQSGFAVNGFGEHSPGHYSLQAALFCKVAMTFLFLIFTLGAADPRASAGFAPIAIDLRGQLGNPGAVSVLGGTDCAQRARRDHEPVAVGEGMQRDGMGDHSKRVTPIEGRLLRSR